MTQAIVQHQQLKLIEYITTNSKHKDLSDVIPHILDAYTTGVVTNTSNNKLITQLHDVILSASRADRAIKWDNTNKVFAIDYSTYCKEMLSAYHTKVEEISDTWHRCKGHVRNRKIVQPSVLTNTSNATQTIPLYGIEIECLRSDDIPTYGAESIYTQVIQLFGGKYKCDIKYDGSLDEEYGMEIVTVPQTFHQLRRTLSKALRPAITQQMLEYDEGCGIHIHLSAEPLTTTQIAYLFYICHIDTWGDFFERVTSRECDHEYGARTGAEWFEADRDKYWLTSYLPEFTRLLGYLNDESRGSLHYSKKHSTLEFRCFNTSLDPEVVLSYLEFVDALQSFCSLSSGGVKLSKNKILPIDFVHWLLDGEGTGKLTNLKPRQLYPHLIRRLVLDIYPRKFTVTNGLVTIINTSF